MTTDIRTTYNRIAKTIEEAQKASPSAVLRVDVVAACKSQNAQTIMSAIDAGITHFGENKVQEAQAKWPAIKAQHPHLTLQLIGALQSNKAKDAVALFDEIASLDRPSLAEALKMEMDKQQRFLPCLIQVNTGEELQKSGIMPADADAFIHYCMHDLKLNIVGLMCVPPQDAYPAPHFALLVKIAKTHGLKRLSMGMSHDYETAVRMGATEVRIGTALFGERIK
jgi:pyridoxal phosphate enzyme (YggS family)